MKKKEKKSVFDDRDQLLRRLEYLEQHTKNLQYDLSVTRENLKAAQYEGWAKLNADIHRKENQRLYRKKGNKYIPVNDPYAYDGLREGFWLIKVGQGFTSIRQQVYPDKAPITAAARDLEDKLTEIILKATAARPNKTPLTEEERKDWEAFVAKHGKSFNTLFYPSFNDNAQQIIKAILNEDY